MRNLCGSASPACQATSPVISSCNVPEHGATRSIRPSPPRPPRTHARRPPEACCPPSPCCGSCSSNSAAHDYGPPRGTWLQTSWKISFTCRSTHMKDEKKGSSWSIPWQWAWTPWEITWASWHAQRPEREAGERLHHSLCSIIQKAGSSGRLTSLTNLALRSAESFSSASRRGIRTRWCSSPSM